MNPNSFRLKMALLSGLIIGLLLLGSGVALWRLTYKIELTRIDREIRNLGAPHLERVQGGDHWVRFESALQFVAGTNAAPAFILWVKSEGRVLHKSPHWPAGLDPDSFPPLTGYEPPYQPKPGDAPPAPPRRGEEISVRNPALPRKSAQFFTREAGGRTWRIGVMGNPYVTLILGADSGEFSAGMSQLRRAGLFGLPFVLLLAGLGAWFLAQRALRPVTALTQTAESVTARGLDQRIPAMEGGQEFNRLITVFNEMMDRLEKSFGQATRFSADASHQLKTPLARLQIELEQAIAAAPSGSREQEVYGSLLDDIGRLKAIVQKLLLLSLADAGRLQLKREPVDLGRLLENVVEDVRAQAPGLAIECDLQPGVRVGADPDLLEQALQNLAGNAIKYNRENGRIRFELRMENETAQLHVGNTGSGIPESDREKVFERFHRTDPSRDGRVEGVGLGLSLAREIVRAHDGELVLESSAEDWTEFAMRLPVLT